MASFMESYISYNAYLKNNWMVNFSLISSIGFALLLELWHQVSKYQEIDFKANKVQTVISHKEF